MGAIQGAIDNLVSTATAAAAVGKHFKEQEENKQLEAAETRVKIGEEMPKIKAEMEEAVTNKQAIEREEKTLTKNMLNPKASEKYMEAASKRLFELDEDKKMANVALQTVHEKITARQMLLDRANKILLRGGKK